MNSQVTCHKDGLTRTMSRAIFEATYKPLGFKEIKKEVDKNVGDSKPTSQRKG